MERDLTLEELIQIGSQLFPDTDPNEIANAIEAIKAEDSSITNSDIMNMVVHMVLEGGAGQNTKMQGIKDLFKNR